MRKSMIMALVAAIFCGMFLGAAVAADEKAQSVISPTKTFESGVILPPWLPKGTYIRVSLPWYESADGSLAILPLVDSFGQLQGCHMCDKEHVRQVIGALSGSGWSNTEVCEPPSRASYWIVVTFPEGENRSITLDLYNKPFFPVERESEVSPKVLASVSLECEKLKEIKDQDFPVAFQGLLLKVLGEAQKKIVEKTPSESFAK